MESLVRKLEDTLKGLDALQTELERVIRRQREAIVKMDHEELLSVNKAEAAVLEQIGELDRRRGEISAELAQKLGMPLEEKHTLERIAKELPEEKRRRLLALRERLVGRVEALGGEAEMNFGLARLGLEHVQSCLNIIFGAGRKRPTYSLRDVGKGPVSALFETTA